MVEIRMSQLAKTMKVLRSMQKILVEIHTIQLAKK